MIHYALTRCRLTVLTLLLTLLGIPGLFAADYQWSVSVDGVSHDGLDPDYPRAFLWIPPNCSKVRAIVLSQHNMEEESILEDGTFRKTLSDLGFAEIWIVPSLGSIHFRFDLGADKILAKVLKDLSTTSGYSEIETAPFVPIGHSATASFGWDIAAWNPNKTLAVLSISGQWPYYKDTNMNVSSSPDWGDRTVDGVPGLITKGEYEVQGNTDGWYFHLKGDSLKVHPKTVLTQVVEPGGDHFNASSDKIALICLFLRKAAEYRLPSTSISGPLTLTPIDPTQTGWLFDEWHLKTGPTAPAAPVSQYQGNPELAFWAFDNEMATAIEAFQAKGKNKTNLLVGYKQKDGLTLPTPDHAEVHLKFEPQDDGLTIKMTGAFWDKVPVSSDGKSGTWNDSLSEGNGPVAAGDNINHPQDDNKITISRICGPVVQTAPNTFVIHPYRIGTHNVRASNDVWFAAAFPGDDTFKSMVERAELRFPLTNNSGTSQTITFPQIPDQIVGATSVKLNATSSADAPISYYVREGPAEVDLDGNLTFTAIPPRAKLPISVTVVATQWGRSIDPKIQTATPVVQTFLIK